MTSSASPQPADETTWHRIDEFLEELSRLAKQTRPDFYGRVEAELPQLLGAGKVIVWLRQEDAWRRSNVPSDAEANPEPALLPWLDQLASTRQQARFNWPDKSERASDLAPVVVNGRTVSVLECRTTGGVERTVQVELSNAVCEIATDFEYRSRLMKRESADLDTLKLFLTEIHGQLDLGATCHAVANECRRLLQLDRVSVLVQRGRRSKLQAISGIDSFDPRSEQVIAVESLANAVCATGEPIWFEDSRSELPEQIQLRLDQYVDHSSCRAISVVPLHDSKLDSIDEPAQTDLTRCHSVIVLERFDAEPFGEQESRWLSVLLEQCQPAIRNAVIYENTPSAVRWLGGLLRTLLVTHRGAAIGLLISVVAFIAILTLVQTEFSIQCRGELRPSTMRKIYAPADGTVERLAASAGQRVEVGSPLLRLRNEELEFEETRLKGELETNRSQLRTIEARISHIRGQSTDDKEARIQLLADQRQVEESVATLTEQLGLIRVRLDQLKVVSPMLGRVLTAGLSDRLQDKPVRRGEHLLTVADLAGSWQLELKVADHDFEHVAEAAARTDDPLAVSFRLIGDPGQRSTARLESLGLTTESNTTEGVYVPALAELEDDELLKLRNGSRVVAHINCGRRSLGYVWLRDFIDVVRSHLF